MSHALPRLVKIIDEAGTFANGPGIIDWAATGTLAYVIEPDVSSLGQAVVPNENIRPRVMAVHKDIHTLRNASLPFGAYMHGSTTNAAEAAAATTTAVAGLDIILKNYFGGRKLGYGIGFLAGTAAAPTVDSITNIDIGDLHFCVDATTGEGQIYRVLALPGGAVITYDRDLHFTPATADRAYSVIMYYFDQTAITDHADAEHETMAMVVVGENTDDVFEAVGCKCNVSIPAITQGVPSKLQIEALVTLSDIITKPAITGTPLGSAGAVPSKGNDTLLLMSDAAGDMIAQSARGAITPDLGIKYERVTGVPGTEGVLGHVATGFESCTVKLMVPFAEDWHDDFESATEKQMLVQIGSTVASQPWGLYYPQLEIQLEPKRTPEQGLTTSDLTLRARENQADPGALAGAQLKLWQSPVILWMVA